MPTPAFATRSSPPGAPAQHYSGFTLVEVILSLGVIAIAIISVLGLIAPTLGEVQQTQELNEGVACIDKMNSLINSAPFWNSAPGASGETVWQWIADSKSDSPTVFLFFNEIPDSTGSTTDSTTVQRVVRFNAAAVADTINTVSNDLHSNVKSSATNRFPLFESMANFLSDVNNSKVSGPVIAMTLSLSPLAQHFPLTAADPGSNSHYANVVEGGTLGFYTPPAAGVLNGLFSDTNFGEFAPDPDGITTGFPFPEAYLPIYVQAFTVSVDGLPSTAGATEVENQIINTFSTGTRLFTYTTAKLR